MTDTHDNSANMLDPASIDPAHPGAAHNAELYVRRGVESSIKGEPAPGPTDEMLAAESPAVMVAEVEKQITRLERDLAEVVRHDPITGAPIGKLTGKVRENAERQLAVLRHTTLPYTKMRAAEIAAAKANIPTTADKLQAEAAKRDRIRARALEIAEETIAKQEAERIIASRRTQSMG